MLVSIRDILGIKIDGELKGIKSTEIPIMDMASTGSVLSKKDIEDTFIVCNIVEAKLDESVKLEEVVNNNSDDSNVDQEVENKNEVQELTSMQKKRALKWIQG